MGPTPIWTPTLTLGMRLSRNFVNVYRIAYHAPYTYTCTRAHPQRTSEEVGEDVRVGVGPMEFLAYMP